MPRPRSAVAFLVALLLFLATPTSASRTSSSSGHHRSTYRSNSSHHSHRYRPPSHHTKRYAYGLPPDKHGRIKRSEAAKREFMRETGYPHGRPGYVVDHIIPLSEGGKDDPSNMQWQTVEEAKAKDKTEGKH